MGSRNIMSGQGIRYRAAPINRLDLPAQGLVFFAKDKKSEAAMNRQFQLHQVRKRYLAATAVFSGVQPSYIIRSDLEWQGSQQGRPDLCPLLPRERRALFFPGFPAERAHPPDPPSFPGAGGAPGRAMSATAGAPPIPCSGSFVSSIRSAIPSAAKR